MKKICNKCKRNRRIGKFSKCSNSKDGKNYYCRDCISSMNKRYRNSIDGRKKHLETVSKWKESNKDKISKYNKKYYEENKERIMFNKKIRDNIEKPSKIKINKDSNEFIIIDPKRK